MGQSIHVNSTQKCQCWSMSTPPVTTVNSGSLVTFDTLDGSNGQITRTSTVDDVSKFNISLADPIFGPVYIRGAEPGDVLEVEIVDLQTADWGWTAIVPGFGLLANEFLEPQLRIWDLPTTATTTEQGHRYAVFREDIRIPIRPFLGIMGVAPGEPGDFSTIPPYDTGGNIDCRHCVLGSRLLLPIRASGALFSCGDGHAAQGDGEVCGSAIETPMKATLRLTVRKNEPWVQSPHYCCPPENTTASPSGCYATTGVDADLLEATRKAVRGMINYLVGTKNLLREEAYMLASVAADLRLTEVVDMPNYVVACSLPLDIFELK